MEMMVISISAVLAGAVCGDHVSPIDATIEAAAEGAKYGFSIPSPDIGMRIALACVFACL